MRLVILQSEILELEVENIHHGGSEFHHRQGIGLARQLFARLVQRWRRTETLDLDGDPHSCADALGRRLGSEIRSEAGLAYQQDRASGW